MQKFVKLLMTTCLVLVAVGMFAGGCSKREEVAATIKIGVAGPYSGDLAPYGIPTKEAAEMVTAEVNAAGGVLGKQIELVPLDDQCKPEIAVNVATKLATEKVKVVIGHVCSGATKAALGIYKEAAIVVISPSATNPPLTQSGDYPNFFRTIAPDDLQGKLAANFVTGKLGAKKVAILHDKGDYGKGFADYAKAALEADGKTEIVVYEGLTPGALDYSVEIQKVQSSGADAVIYGGYHPEASKLVGLMKKKQLDLPFIGPDGVKGSGFLEIAGPDAEGVYATGPVDVSQLAANQQARAGYVQRFGKQPGTFFNEGYAAMQAAVNAIKVANSTDYAAISQALRTNYVETAVGRIKFDARGDAEGVDFSVYQVINGTFSEVK